MKLLDYLIQTGEKQGNSKHFQNFLKIHSHMLKIERENDTAKGMIDAKNDLLIHKGQKEKVLKLEVSRLEIEIEKLNKIIEDKDNQIKDLVRENKSDFTKALDNWSLEERDKRTEIN